MSMKRPLILTAVLVVAATAVHSQGSNPAEVMTPAALFADSPVPASPANSQNGDGAAHGAAPSPDQPFALPTARPAAAVVAAPAQANEVDTSALRYFASQNDLVRVTAEIRLLRAKHPGWEPPQDLFTDTKSGELEWPMWTLFANHDYEGVRAAIAKLQQSNPDYQPSASLIAKLNLAEASQKLVDASDSQDWNGVVEIASANKMLLTCSQVDALWRTAEALIHLDDEPRATEAYRYILTSCVNPAERLATVQKASVLLKSPEGLDGLIALGKRLPGGKSEFESVKLDRIRARIGDAAAGKAEALQADVDALSAHARASKDKNDEQLLGWLHYARKDYDQAEGWFRMALASGPAAKPAEGLVLTLRAAGKLPEALKLALQYAPLDHANRKLLIDVFTTVLDDPKATAPSADELAAFTKAMDDEHASDGAQIYGWRLYNANAFTDAQTWFKKSVEWQPSEAAVTGLILTAKKMNQAPVVAALMAKYHEAYPKIAQLDVRPAAPVGRTAYRRGRSGDGGWDKNAQEIVATLHDGKYDETLSMLDSRREHRGSEPAGLDLVRGWALYHKGDWDQAKKAFASAQARGHSADAQVGLTMIEHGYLPPALR
jgi:tetratricopeptide (TPR) repeat protein